MLEKNTYTIPKKTSRKKAEDYELLRSYGLDYIQKLGGKLWTDYNIHDPGITILELLCYALTDLGYRTAFPIQDILTPPGEKGPEMKNAFFSANKILTSHPITPNDYRKLIIESVPGVRNIWFEINDTNIYSPFIDFDSKKNSNIFINTITPNTLKLKGLYNVKIELEDYNVIKNLHKDFLDGLKKYKKDISISVNSLNYKECYKNYVQHILMSHRNLCEDFNEIKILKEIPVGICADIELKPQAKEEKILVEIYKRIYEYINPSIQLYTYQKLLEKGKKVEDIFQGSSINRGFIDYDELNSFERKKVLHTSDIINIIMDIDGVLNIRSIQFTKNQSKNNNEFQGKTCIHLENEKDSFFRFHFDLNTEPEDRLNKLFFRKGMIYFLASPKKYYKITDIIDFYIKPDHFENDLPLPRGKNRELDNYISFQDEFPKAYMVGREGISDNSDNLRKAQRLQLKGYLLFFDQLLADYLTQLNNVKDLLSWRDPLAEETYNYKTLSENEIHDFEKIFTDYEKYQSFVLEPVKIEKNRRNRFLDHLLARFNEKFVDYTIFKFVQNSEGSSYDYYANNEVIHDKKEFLKRYPEISGNRSHAINYTHPCSSTNFTMLELRISKALGVDSINMNRILAPEISSNVAGKIIFKNNSIDTFDKTFGLHIYEHILFRPLYNDTVSPKQEFLKLYYGPLYEANSDKIIKDPYSLKATVVLPGWLAISGRMEFRRFVEYKIRMEMPAHIGLKICWINPRQMMEIESNYTAFITQLNKLFIPGNNTVKTIIVEYRKALNKMVSTLSSLKNIYPPSALDEAYNFLNGNSKQTPVILDNTALVGGSDENWAFENTLISKPTPKKKVIKKKINK